MDSKKNGLRARWGYLAIGVVAMLFAGVLYAWSILKVPLAAAYGWGASELALNFTFAMCFFCVGGVVGARLAKAIGHRATLSLAGVLAAAGFCLTGSLHDPAIGVLYICYGVLAGTGIGIAYNVVVATVSAWFPDRKGVCSGCLMMGFGMSALVLGNVADALFKSSLGWRNTYLLLGGGLCLVLLLAACLLRKPDAQVAFPQHQKKKVARESFAQQDFTTGQMLRRPSFWLALVYLTFLSAVGSSVISFAKDLSLSVNAPEAVAVLLVGVLSVCNGLGRVLTGAAFDGLGRRTTMLSANILTICASGITLLAVCVGSLPLCILGLCFTGISYGACATINAAFTSSFYGLKYYSSNMALMTCNAMGASFIATMSNKVFEATGGYIATFGMLLALSSAALVLNLCIRKP